jgi:hypothetical protein
MNDSLKLSKDAIEHFFPAAIVAIGVCHLAEDNNIDGDRREINTIKKTLINNMSNKCDLSEFIYLALDNIPDNWTNSRFSMNQIFDSYKQYYYLGISEIANNYLNLK